MAAPAAAEAATPAELGIVLSQMVGRVVPHDGYLLAGLDPLAGTGCLVTAAHGNNGMAHRRLEIDEAAGRDLHSPAALAAPAPAGVPGDSGLPRERHNERLHEIMAEAGSGSELRLLLKTGGRVWGMLGLLREPFHRPFSPDDALRAQRLSAPLAHALKRHVTGRPLRPVRSDLAPGLIVVDGHDTVRAASATAHDWLQRLGSQQCGRHADDPYGHIRNIVSAARRDNGEALARLPEMDGWIELRGQLIGDPQAAEVVVTVQPASGTTLLSAITAWYDITPKEHLVVRHLLDALPSKQIAKRLGVSQHTVHDHLKSIYRKTGVSGRDELLAGLAR
ncbi:hypothetical protein Pta02_35280 [Planobispora takensis]|uniref:HTH luxR-type domain-containing protein n=2 Tax=Planobispora takensis TaxID=1367882 RepID=A0A8J3SY87_9ACTN|nr:hypothetical protein Pta02_35280 [Planobispora takensis]